MAVRSDLYPSGGRLPQASYTNDRRKVLCGDAVRSLLKSVLPKSHHKILLEPGYEVGLSVPLWNLFLGKYEDGTEWLSYSDALKVNQEVINATVTGKTTASLLTEESHPGIVSSLKKVVAVLKDRHPDLERALPGPSFPEYTQATWNPEDHSATQPLVTTFTSEGRKVTYRKH